MWGGRSGFPLLGGITIGVFLALLSFPEQPAPVCMQEWGPIDSSEHWVVRQEKLPVVVPDKTSQKVVRARFAATELGIRERLLVIVWAEGGGLAVALNATLSPHVPRVIALADAARLDLELSSLPNMIPWRANGLHAHSHILNAVFNQTLHEKYDWFLMVKESTYINPFALHRFINKVSWNEKVVVGWPSEAGRCDLDGGVLLSNPAMQLLIQERHSCHGIAANSEQLAFELCIYQATNLSCESSFGGRSMSFWRVPAGQAPHDAIGRWAGDGDGFNRSLSVAPLLSDADSRALHDHFVRVEKARVAAEIAQLQQEVTELSHDLPDGPSWPPAVPPYFQPPNRYQVPVWEFFTSKDIFKNEPNQNVRPLEAADKEDVDEVLAAARNAVESEAENTSLQFVQLRNGYRMFDARRGMDYMLDLVYRDSHSMEHVDRRVHISRTIATTHLMQQVPYVKEDADLTVVVPVADEQEVLPARRLLARQARLCTSVDEETRHTRIVIALSSNIHTRSHSAIANDLEELKKRCKRASLETSVLRVRVEASLHAAASLDEAVDHYGPQSMFLLLSPHADIQKEFLDRVRINTIKRYQVFMPIPFIEYHPTLAGMDAPEGESPAESRTSALNRLRDGAPPQRRKQLVVQKDHGRFDTLDFSVLCVYGTDYMHVRSKLEGKRLDLVSLFLGSQEMHVLRAIEPSLRIRYHRRECDGGLVDEDLLRCVQSKRENLAGKDQLVRLLFNEE